MRSGRIHVYDLSEEQPRATFKAHQGLVTGLVFHPDGRTWFSSSRDKSIKRWQGEACWKETGQYRTSSSPEALAIARTTGLLAYSDLERIRFLNGATLKPEGRDVQAGGSVLGFSPISRHIAAADAKNLLLVDPETGNVVQRLQDPEAEAAHEGGPACQLQFHPDGSLLLSASSQGQDRKVKLWETATGRLLTSLVVADDTAPISCAFSPDGRSLVVSGGGETVLYELSGEVEQTVIGLHSQAVRAFRWSPDGRSLACLAEPFPSDLSQDPGEITLWDSATGQLRTRRASSPLPRDFQAVPALAFHPQWQGLAYCRSTQNIHFWRPEGGKEPSPISAGGLADVHFAPGGRLWATVNENEIWSWDFPEGRGRRVWSNVGARVLHGVSTITTLRAGREWVVSGGRDGHIRLLQAADGSFVSDWPGPGSPIRSVAVTADETLAAVGVQKGTVRLLTLPAGKVVADLSSHRDSVESIAFCPDAQLLATASKDHTVRVWQRAADSFHEVLVLHSPTGPVTEVQFSPDGCTLALLVAKEKAVRLWHLPRLRTRLREMCLDW
jgi:WD40 repeat protein